MGTLKTNFEQDHEAQQRCKIFEFFSLLAQNPGNSPYKSINLFLENRSQIIKKTSLNS